MKTTMIKGLSMTAKGYKDANPSFPDQSTGDQFFDEKQFEAYREVGYRICSQMLDDLKLESHFKENARPNLGSNFRKSLEENYFKTTSS